MNTAAVQSCPYCCTTLDISGPIHICKNDPLNDIYLCNSCGLIYKPFVSSGHALKIREWYHPSSWRFQNRKHDSRLASIVENTTSTITIADKDAVLDIGAGIGMAYPHLRKIAKSRYIALEPSLQNAKVIKKTYPEVSVVNSDINSTILPPKAFKLILVLGVCYLFTDIRQAFKKILNSLADDGLVVIQRNVFVDQSAYVGHKIDNIEDLFGANPIMRNWFHAEQYSSFLRQFFFVNHESRELQSYIVKGKSFEGFFMNYLCSRLDSAGGKSSVSSWHTESLAHLQRLGWYGVTDRPDLPLL